MEYINEVNLARTSFKIDDIYDHLNIWLTYCKFTIVYYFAKRRNDNKNIKNKYISEEKK